VTTDLGSWGSVLGEDKKLLSDLFYGASDPLESFIHRGRVEGSTASVSNSHDPGLARSASYLTRHPAIGVVGYENTEA
jgi:hypothetical protein